MKKNVESPSHFRAENDWKRKHIWMYPQTISERVTIDSTVI